MYRWPHNFQDLFYSEHGITHLCFWKVFFRDYYYRDYEKPRDDKFNKYLNFSIPVVAIGSKIVPIDKYGYRLDKYARETSHLERLFWIISRNIDHKAYIDLNWDTVVRNAEDQLQNWIQQKERRLAMAINYSTITPHIIKSPYQWKEDLKKSPKPEPLWLDLWYQNEIACLFGDSNLGKSIYAVQIATHIAQTRRTLYLDYEMDEHSFVSRYTDDSGKFYNFPLNFHRAQFDPNTAISKSFLNDIFTHLEFVIREEMFEVVIIDNFTFITAGDPSGVVAANFIYRLKILKAKYNVSFLVVAHTTRKDPSLPLTADHLMANRRFYHFLDSVFGLSRSASNKSLLYIKQIKCRNRTFTNGEDNVILSRIQKNYSFLSLETIGNDKEENLLLKIKGDRKQLLAERVAELRYENFSFSQIAEKLNISKAYAIKLFNIISPKKQNAQ